MSLYRTPITADGVYFLCNVNKPRNLDQWKGTFNCYGSSFGGGTLTFQVSTDGGTTKVPLDDATGTPVSLTAAGNFNNNLGNGSTLNDAPKLYATMAGSTNPNVTVDVIDNR